MNSSFPPPELPPDIAALFASERNVPAPPDATRAQVLSRVQTAVIAGASVAGLSAWFAKSAFAKGIVVVAVVGTAAAGGAWTIARVRHAQSVAASTTEARELARRRGRNHATLVNTAIADSVQAVEPTPVLPTAVPVQPMPVVEPASTEPAPSAPIAARAPSRGSSSSSGDDAVENDRLLARENELLGEARAAFSHRDGRTAIHALARHADEFPHGRLSEERDAIWVEALALEGDTSAALRRGEQFRARHPHSVYLSVVDSALAGIRR